MSFIRNRIKQNHAEISRDIDYVDGYPVSDRRQKSSRFGLLSKQRLSDQMDTRAEETTLPRGRGIIVGFQEPALSQVVSYLAKMTIRTSVSVCNFEELHAAMPHLSAFDLIIMNLDSFDDMEDAIEALVTFKKAHSRFTVVAISEHVKADDLGTSRRPMCDATLKSPFGQDRFKDAVEAALENHAEASSDIPEPHFAEKYQHNP